jgi:multidrug resistance efflux pump
MMSKKLFWMLTLSFAALALSACKSSAAATPDASTLPPAGIIAQGHIEPQFSQDVSFTAPGQVVEVLVAEGDAVTAGQVLARLSGGELRAVELARAEQELLAAQKAMDDLQANPDLIKTQSAAAVAAAEKALDDAKTQINDLKNPDPLLVAQLEAHIALLDQQLSKANDDLKTLEDQTSPDALKLAQAKSAVADLEKAQDDAKNSLDKLNNPDKLLLAQLEASLPVLEAQLATAKSNAQSLADGVDDDLLAAAKARLATAQAALTSAQANTASLELHAPAAGTVVGLNLKAGQVVSAGLPVMTIADLNTWVVKTDDLTEIEVVSVTPGEAVSIVLDALPDAPLNGTVSEIATRFEDRRGDVTYTVTISLSEVPANLRWGMTGQVQFTEGK